MKQLIDDIMSENFTRRDYIIYGIVYPLGLIAVMLIASLFE
jgi:hypothetical protein